jgi:hypothetical protein
MRLRVLGLCVLLAATGVASLPGQRVRGRRENVDYSKFNTRYDGRFTFLRLRYVPLDRGWGRFGGGDEGWAHDYPRAERNLMKLLSELTEIRPYMDGGNIFPLDDAEIFRYPIAYLSEPGFWSLTAAEAAGLRAYLEKGGFLIVDDFDGYDWVNFEEKMRQVLPEKTLMPLDVSHPVFHSFFEIESLETLSFGGYRSVSRGAEYHGIFENNDPAGRLMVVVNYNNDIGDYWEWSDQGFFPIELSNEAYKLGINYIVYAMTH